MRTIVAAALILVAGPVLAEPIPKSDVVAACQRYVARPEFQGGANEKRFSFCLENVQGYYDIAKSTWDMNPESEQRTCIAENDVASHEFYKGLVTCLSRAGVARVSPTRPLQKEFRY